MKPETLYAILLRLYPAAFRETYEREMRAAFKRRSRDESGAIGQAVLWLSVLADTLATAPREHFDMLIHDIRYSLRALRKTPVFTIAVLVTLALGVGATTTIYSLVHTVLLRPLPYSEPDRLVRIWETNEARNIPFFAASLLNLLSWQEESRSFEALAAVRNESANLTGDGEPRRLKTAAVSANFWTVTGLKPIIGRAFLPGEDEPGKALVAMLSEGLWLQRYGGDSTIVGRAILVNGEPRIVIGIAPQDVGYTGTVDLWIPLVPNLARENRGNHVVAAVGRLRPGVSLTQADAELNAVAARLEQRYPQSNTGWRVRLTPVEEWIVDDDSRASLYVLMVAVALLLSAACANIAGLLITRAAARSHEFGLRLALGAGRARLVRQLTTESLVLASLGGGLGIFTALASVQWLAARVANQLPRSTNLTVNWPVLLFAIGLTIAVGLVFGVAPSWSTRRADLMTTLRKAGRGTAGSAGNMLRSVLVGAQIAVATVLVVCALLLIQSFARLQKVELGFRPDHLLTASISLPPAKYPTAGHAEAFYKTLLTEIEGIAGVASAGLSSGVPMGGSNPSMSIVPIERSENVPDERIQVFWRQVDAKYLHTLGVPLKSGRLFDASDRPLTVIILSEGLARRLWPGRTDVVGRRVRVGNAAVGITVVGIVGDVRQLGLSVEPQSTMYFPPIFDGRALTLAVRTTGDPADLAGALRAAVHRLDPVQPLFDIRTMDEILESNTERPRLETALLTAFAILAFVLGVVGVTGIVAYTVERRSPELALRLAVGATPAQAMRHAARGGLTAAVIGLILGLLGAWGLSHYLSTLLYQVRPDDPWTFTAVGTALLVATAIACWLPARRATLIDPAATLKKE